jgi:ribosome-binding protein aMBF1 (putative translation factor)
VCEHERVNTDVATAILRHKEEHGWSYRKLAKQLRVPLGTAHDMATGKRDFSLSEVKSVARRLKIEIVLRFEA